MNHPDNLKNRTNGLTVIELALFALVFALVSWTFLLLLRRGGREQSSQAAASAMQISFLAFCEQAEKDLAGAHSVEPEPPQDGEQPQVTDQIHIMRPPKPDQAEEITYVANAASGTIIRMSGITEKTYSFRSESTIHRNFVIKFSRMATDSLELSVQSLGIEKIELKREIKIRPAPENVLEGGDFFKIPPPEMN